ncbi:MAG: cyclic-di-AMP receptor [Chloroflexota bacterium]|nr:MAG: cyclic-di-AMP receptor [Chloroflexota bacterium]
MKLIIAIVRDEICDQITQSLIKDDFRVTRIASTGGFLRRGMTTLMIGIEDEKVDQVVHIIGDECGHISDQYGRCATLFVLNVDNFIQV